MFTPDLLQHVFGCSIERATLFCAPLNDTAAEFSINTPKRGAAFLGQVGEESGRLAYVEEIASGAAYNGRKDLGNMRPEAFKWAAGATPGPYFKGHSLLMVTGYDAHRDCGAYLYPGDPDIFLRNPRLLCQVKDAARGAGWVWAIFKDLNPLADVDDFRGITHRINGGFNGMADRLLMWSKAKAALGIGPAPARAPMVIDQAPATQPAARIGADDIAAAERALHMGDSSDGSSNNQ